MRYLVYDITQCHIPEELIPYLRIVYKSVCKVTSLENAYFVKKTLEIEKDRLYQKRSLFSYESFPISQFLS